MSEINEKEIKRRFEAISSFKARPEVTARDLERVRQLLTRQETRPQNIWRIITRSRIAQIAAAAVIITGTSLFFIQQEQPGEVQTQQITQTAKSPAELVSSITLNMAFRDGGMQSMEKQFDKAEKKVKLWLKTSLTVEQLICELNGCQEI